MKLLILRLLMVGALLHIVSSAQGQVDVSAWPTVRVGMTVTAKDGSSVLPTKDSLGAEENGRAVTISEVTTATEPQSVCLLIDTSKSVEKELTNLQAAGERLLRQLPSGDEGCVATFDLSAHLLQPMTEDRSLLSAALARPLRSGWATALFDVLLSVAQSMERNAKYRSRAIVVLSDGDDNYSRVSEADLTHKLSFLNMPSIDFVYWPEETTSQSGQKDDAKKLSTSSGGLTYSPQDPRELMAAIDRLTDAMSHRLVMTYVSPAPEADGHLRKLSVRGPKGTTVAVPSAFMAPAK
jgi:hypothetical protein